MTDQRVTHYRSSVGKRTKKAKRRPKTTAADTASSADAVTSGADPAATNAETLSTGDVAAVDDATADTAADTAAIDAVTIGGVAVEKKKPKKRKKRSRAITRAKIATGTTRRGNGTRR